LRTQSAVCYDCGNQTRAACCFFKKDASAWLELIRNYTDIQELDRVVLGELIEKITVGEAQVINGEKHVDITVDYRFVGAVGIA